MPPVDGVGILKCIAELIEASEFDFIHNRSSIKEDTIYTFSSRCYIICYTLTFTILFDILLISN